MESARNHAATSVTAGNSAAANDIGLAAAINQAGQAVVISDPGGNIEYVNAAFTVMTGYSAQEVIGRNTHLLKSGNQDASYYGDLWATIAAGRNWHGELVNRRKDGSLYTEEMTIAPVLDSNGDIARYIALKQDVTERRRTEEALRFLAAIVASSEDAVIGTTLDGSISFWNEGAEAIYGYSAEEAIGKPIQLLSAPDREAETMRIAEGVARGQALSHFDTVSRAKDGRLVDVSLTVSPVYDRAGKIVGTASIAHGIEERLRADMTVRDSAERFRTLFERSLDCLYIHDFAGNFLDANPATLKLLGYEREELLAMNSSRLLSVDEMVKALRGRLELERTGTQKESIQFRLKCKSGAFVDVETKSTLISFKHTPRAILGVARDITERKRAEQALQHSEARFRIMADCCPTMMWVTDSGGGVQFVNRAYNEFFGTTYEQVEGSSWQPLVHPDDASGYVGSFLQAVDGRTPFQAEARVRRADGEWRWVTSYADPHWGPDHAFLGHVGVTFDNTERKQAEQALLGSEDKFRTLAENIREVFWMMNAAGTEILYVSPGYEQIWGRTCAELYRNPTAWLESIEPDDRKQAHTVFLTQMDGQDLESEYRIRTPGGDVKWVRDRAFAVRGETGEIVRVVGIAEDISARKKVEQELAHQARHDHLTGLPNRLLLSDRLDASIEHARQSGLMTAVIYVDLDGFKFVNDSLGHEAGDAVLQQATLRLQAFIREPDTLARMGGDEFMVVINDVREDQIASAIAERLRSAMRKSFLVADRELYLTASLGIAMYPRDGRDVSTLRRNADAAMYEAKRGGKDRVLFFRPAMQSTFLERLEMDTELRRAIERNQLSLEYQPIYKAQGGDQSAFEALLRWTHPALGSIPSDTFVPVAEESGLMGRLGVWVLEEACRKCRAWQEHGLAGVRVAVNVSATEFALPEFVGRVLRVLDQTGLPGHLLDLELTETTLMRDMEGSIVHMTRLRERGIRISIDDFGTGYSSLGYLARLPVDVLKIDRSFVAELGTSGPALALIQGMISLAHSIGKRVVLEGVETHEQLEILRSIGADEIQGFLLGRPVSLPDWNASPENAVVEEALALEPVR